MNVLTIPILLLLVTQTQPAATQPSGEDVLAGPQVRETKAAPTLVRRSFDGSLEDLEEDVEVEAVGLLELNEDQEAIRDRIIVERNAIFDQCVRRNYELIVDLVSLQGTDNPDERAALMGRVREGFEPFFRRGTFLSEIQDHLNNEQRELVNHLVNEYRMTIVDDVRTRLGPRASVGQAVTRIRIDALGRMIRQSIERQVRLEREEFDQLTQSLGLTPEQVGKAQAIFQPLAIKQFQDQEVHAAERRAALREFSRILTREQRWTMLGLIAERIRRDPAASQPSSQ
jgi:hypothetical protein